MPKLFQSTDPAAVAHSVREHMHSHRFMVVVTDIVGNHMLYGSTLSCHEAKIEAATDHPLAELTKEIEYLPEGIRQHLNTLAKDPVATALKALGKVNPLTDTPI